MSVKFDDLLIDINDFGKYQKIRYALICLAGLLPPIATYIHSFMAALPEFECNNNKSIQQQNSNFSKTSNCFYTYGNGTEQSCTSWKFDKKYFNSTLTEEVNFNTLSFYCNLFCI